MYENVNYIQEYLWRKFRKTAPYQKWLGMQNVVIYHVVAEIIHSKADPGLSGTIRKTVPTASSPGRRACPGSVNDRCLAVYDDAVDTPLADWPADPS